MKSRTVNTTYQIKLEGITYDNEHVEEVVVNISFGSLGSIKDFIYGFYLFCEENNLIDIHGRVNFKDIRDRVLDNNLPRHLYIRDIHFYSSGYFCLPEHVAIHKLVTIIEHEVIWQGNPNDLE